MADLVRKGIVFLQSARKAVNSVDGGVTIRRTGETSLTAVTARVAGSRDAVDQFGAIVVGSDRDFVIPADEYDFGAGPVEPQAGDVIVDPSSGESIEYELRDMGQGDAAEWSDNYGLAWRVHTVRRPPSA